MGFLAGAAFMLILAYWHTPEPLLIFSYSSSDRTGFPHDDHEKYPDKPFIAYDAPGNRLVQCGALPLE